MIKNRLDRIYENKLDGQITESKYTELRKKYESEEQDALETLTKHKNANSKAYDYGLLVMSTTKRALEILTDENRPDEIKREYYKIIFSTMNILGRDIDAKYNSAFDLLANFNSKIEKYGIIKENIFELPINGLDKKRTGSFEPVHSLLLPGPDSNRRPIG